MRETIWKVGYTVALVTWMLDAFVDLPNWIFYGQFIVASGALAAWFALALRDHDHVWPWSGDGDISRDVW